MELILNNVTLCFPDIFRPTSYNNGDPKFSCTLLVSKADSYQLQLVENAIMQALQLKFGNSAQALFNQIRHNNQRCCYGDGDTKTYAGFAGNMFIKTSNKGNPPQVVNQALQPVFENSGLIHSGCIVNAHIKFFAYDAKGIKGVSANILGIQYMNVGQFFDGEATPTVSGFQAMPVPPNPYNNYPQY